MDAKLTPEQAIKMFLDARYEYITTVNHEGADIFIPVKQIASLIESQTRDAELGRLALKARNNYCCGGKFQGKDNGTCESCTMFKFCERAAEIDRLQRKGGE